MILSARCPLFRRWTDRAGHRRWGLRRRHLLAGTRPASGGRRRL